MSIFGTIMSKIFEHHGAQAAPASPPASAQPSAGAAPQNAGRPPISSTAEPQPQTTVAANQDTPTASPVTTPSSTPTVDVAAVLDGLAAKNSQKLDWKHSIVDMMKLLDLDSSFSARKSLAQELHYTGSTDDSASMNVWLHAQVMKKLEENGGKVPADLED